MITNVMWLGFAVSDAQASELFALDPVPAVQTHKFGWSFVRSLKHAFGNVTLASTCPIQSFPIVRQLIFRGGSIDIKGTNGVLLGFINVVLLKHITRFLACLISVIPLMKRKRIQWLIVHGIHTPYLFFAFFTRFMGCKVAVVLTDPPGVLLATDGQSVRLLKRVDAWMLGYILQRMDAVFALAPELVKRLAPDRPALIFPGILESTLNFNEFNLSFQQENTLSKSPFTIVYAGGLSKAYGVDRLIDAVLSFDTSTPVRLKLYGRGDQESKIQQLSKQDSRIVYGGFVDTLKLLPKLCASDLLINPRPTNELFAQMSFPSKLIEYLATGRPVLTTRISSIPADMSEHFYYINDESAKGIRLSIDNVMATPIRQRNQHGIAAQNYVRNQFSEAAMGQKIAEFIKNLN